MRNFFMLISIAAIAAAQSAPEVLLHQDFESGEDGWAAMGTGGAVKVTREPGAAHSGSGALAFTYEARPRQMSAAVLPSIPALARMQRLRFWLKTDHDAPIAVLLSERKPGGGNYTAVLWSPKNTWQHVDLTMADFALSDGPNDPKDSNGKLDLDQLQGIGILDLGQLLPGGPPAPPAAASYTLWLDDLEALGGPATTSTSDTVDNFDRGFLQWIGLAGMKPMMAPAANPLGESAMQISYESADDRMPLLTRRLASYDLSKATRVAFDIASETDATIAISLETKRPGAAQGPRFNLPIYPPAKREVFHVELKLEDFEGQGKLDPSLLKSMVISDISAQAGGDIGKNTIWIGRLRFF